MTSSNFWQFKAKTLNVMQFKVFIVVFCECLLLLYCRQKIKHVTFLAQKKSECITKIWKNCYYFPRLFCRFFLIMIFIRVGCSPCDEHSLSFCCAQHIFRYTFFFHSYASDEKFYALYRIYFVLIIWPSFPVIRIFFYYFFVLL